MKMNINNKILDNNKFLKYLVCCDTYKLCKHFINSILFIPVYVFCVVYSILLYWLLYFVHSLSRFKDGKDDGNTVSIVAIAKNEGSYVREWVVYHNLLGIDHIYLYNNGSTDDTISSINDYVKSGFVSVIDFPGDGRQLEAYNNALKIGDGSFKYMAFIDCDEFIVTEPNKSFKASLDEIIRANPNAGGIALNWKMYGSSGFCNKQAGLVIETFLYRANTLTGKGNECIKTVLMPKRVKGFSHPHYPNYKLGYYGISTDGEIVPEWFHKITEYSNIWINHYFTKSLEEWISRRSLGKADVGSVHKRPIQEFYEHDNNDVYDTSAIACININSLKESIYNQNDNN